MENLKKWLPMWLLIAAGIIALSFGFYAAFSKVSSIDKTTDVNLSDIWKGLSSLEGKKAAYLARTDWLSHTGMAYIGGIISGILGSFSLGASVFVGHKINKDDLNDRKIVLIFSITVFVILLSLGIASFVCNINLDSDEWRAKQILKTLESQ